MHIEVLVAEIGSTTTVVSGFTALDTLEPEWVGQGLHPTTVEAGDVRIGLRGAVEDLKRSLGTETLTWDEMMACSSAAGGLRMTVHGLVYDMTVKAANEAALGAGAVVKHVTAGPMNDHQVEKTRSLAPNIILLAGGVDYGEQDTVLHNARRLRDINAQTPIIYAGNVACQEEIREILGDRVVMVENVYPRIDRLNVEPTRSVIQQVFERHIVRAPGMSHVRDMVSGEILPTPGAVMRAAEHLREVMGDLLVIDVGGATTDVHSVTDGSEEIQRLLIAPEPRAKRTVEGDLGVFVNARNLVSRMNAEVLSGALGTDVHGVLDELRQIPANATQRELVLRLTHEAVNIALRRHAGTLRYLYGPSGRTTSAEGKDLSEVRWVIGTGGALTRLLEGRSVLMAALQAAPPMVLFPRNARALVDRNYIMAACGMLCGRYPEAASRILLHSLDITEADIV